MGSVSFVMDLGFLVAPEEHPTAILPIKKPKGKKLNKIAKQFNQRLASARVKIEHAFAGIKRLKIIRQKIRIPYYQKRQAILKIATTIHNSRVTCRNPIQSNS